MDVQSFRADCILNEISAGYQFDELRVVGIELYSVLTTMMAKDNR